MKILVERWILAVGVLLLAAAASSSLEHGSRETFWFSRPCRDGHEWFVTETTKEYVTVLCNDDPEDK